MIAFAVASTIAVALGILPMPFGYYALLRVVLCMTGAVGFVAARRVENTVWPWVYGVLVVLYNPVLPVHLGSKPLWVFVNLATLGVVWVGAPRFRGRLSAPSGAKRQP